MIQTLEVRSIGFMKNDIQWSLWLGLSLNGEASFTKIVIYDVHSRTNVGDILHNLALLCLHTTLDLVEVMLIAPLNNDMCNIYKESSQISCDANHRSVRNTSLKYNNDELINKETKPVDFLTSMSSPNNLGRTKCTYKDQSLDGFVVEIGCAPLTGEVEQNANKVVGLSSGKFTSCEISVLLDDGI